MASRLDNPIVFLTGAIAVGLVYSAVVNRSPVEFFRAALAGGDTDSVSSITSPTVVAPVEIEEASEPGGTFSPFPAATTEGGDKEQFPVDPDNLVTVKSDFFGRDAQLIPEAAAAFRRWETAYGSPINLTSAYRSAASQAANAAREPGRYASVGLHPRGIAVDVTLQTTTDGQSTISQTRYKKLVDAGRITGWITYTGGTSGDTHHFSWGAVG